MDNLEIVKRVWAGIEGSSELVQLEHIADDVEVHDHDVPDAQTFHGHDGVRRWLENWQEVWDEVDVRAEEFIEAGENRVVAVIRLAVTGGDSGIALERQDAIVYELEAGMVKRVDYFNNTADAFATAGIDAGDAAGAS